MKVFYPKMKPTTDTFNNLLETLSQQGDSSAFLSLCEPYLRARYQKERNSGISHPDASLRVLAEATELFESFISVSPRRRSEWIDEQCVMTTTDESDSEEVLLDSTIVSEAAEFIRTCSRELMKTASHIRKKQYTQNKNPFYRATHSPLTFPIGIPILLTVFISLVCTLTYFTGTEISFSITTPEKTFSIHSPVKCRKESEPLLSHLPLIVDTSRSDSAALSSDSLPEIAVPEKEITAPAIKKETPKQKKPRRSAVKPAPEKTSPPPVVQQPEPPPVDPTPAAPPVEASPIPESPAPAPVITAPPQEPVTPQPDPSDASPRNETVAPVLNEETPPPSAEPTEY